MHRYVPKRILTKSTMRHRSKLTRILASGSVTLLLASCASWNGPEQDFVPSVSPTLPLTDESQSTGMVSSAEGPSPINLNELASEPVAKYTSEEITLVCQTVYGEARGCSKEEQQLVVWCICNRVDYSGTSVEQVVTADRQFHGYDPENPVTEEIFENVTEVLEAWSRNEEALVYEPYATTTEYRYFSGDGRHNWYREEW